MHLLEALCNIEAVVTDLLDVTDDIDIQQLGFDIRTGLHALGCGLLEDIAHTVDAVFQLKGHR